MVPDGNRNLIKGCLIEQSFFQFNTFIMKMSFVILLFTFWIKHSSGQTHPIVGAWNWSDSTIQTSLFFKQSGNISMHSGPKDAPMLTKDMKKGKYVIVNNFLTITWDDNSRKKQNQVCR